MEAIDIQLPEKLYLKTYLMEYNYEYKLQNFIFYNESGRGRILLIICYSRYLSFY